MRALLPEFFSPICKIRMSTQLLSIFSRSTYQGSSKGTKMYFIRDSMNRSNVDSPRYWLSTHRLFKKTRRSLNFNNQNIYCTWKKTLPTCIYYTKITCLMIIYWILKPDRHSTVHLIDQLLQNGVILLDTLSVTWYSVWFFFFLCVGAEWQQIKTSWLFSVWEVAEVCDNEMHFFLTVNVMAAIGWRPV